MASAAVGATILVINLSLQAARVVVHPARNPGPETPADYGMTYESMTFQSLDGIKLTGWFVPGRPGGSLSRRPEALEGPVEGKGGPAVVLAHGHAASKDGMLTQAAYLQQAGYATLLFDFRANGYSEGTASTLGFYEWQDVAGALRYLQSRKDVDPARIGALGASMGAAAVLLMGREATGFAALVADSSFSTAESMVGRFDRWFRLPSWPFSVSVPWAIQREVGVTPAQVAPLKRIAEIAPIPLFLIHGEQDSQIPVEDVHLLYAAAGDPKELWVVPGAAHAGGHDLLKPEYEARVLAFFGRHLGVP